MVVLFGSGRVSIFIAPLPSCQGLSPVAAALTGSGSHPSSAENSTGWLILLQQRPRPLAPGLSRRPCSAAYGPGPAVFTIRARKAGTDRASVSQAVARRGTPPLPPMSLGTCRRCCRGGTPAERKPVSAFLRICFPSRHPHSSLIPGQLSMGSVERTTCIPASAKRWNAASA